MSFKKGTTVYLNVTSAYDPISVNNNYDELVLIRAPIDTAKASYQPDTSTLY